MSEIDVTKCTRYCADNGKCTAFKGMYLCSERANCYTKRIIKKQMIIDKLNNQLHRYKQVIKKIQNIAITHDMPSCLKNDCNCDICQDKITGHGQKCIRNGLRKIIQKCEEMNKCAKTENT